MKWCFIYILDNQQFISVGKGEELKISAEVISLLKSSLWFITPCSTPISSQFIILLLIIKDSCYEA